MGGKYGCRCVVNLYCLLRQILQMERNRPLQCKKQLYDIYFSLIKKSAYAGLPEAEFDYAQQFDTMTFIAVDNPFYNPKKCIYQYTKSAEGGYAEAYNNLADFYERGVGVRKDIRKSYELYRKGAELGSDNAKESLKIFNRDIKNGKYNLKKDL